MTNTTLPDLTGRPDIEKLVNAFYDTVRQDDKLGVIFDEVAQVNWETHLPKMYSFWETVLFRSGGYKGDPIAAHARFISKADMSRAQFDHWLMLFEATVDKLFAGENTGHIKRCAEDMANVIHGKINGIQDPRFDPANLTPEQKARYAKYKKTP
ncbi:group III truncated hemoglobin [Akkermansiaceae bacterium]|nr:group III truncated hemoglobin [Akkermansiaceae bacterium]